MNYLDVLLAFMMIIIQTNELTEQFIFISFSYRGVITFKLKLLPHIFYTNISI